MAPAGEGKPGGEGRAAARAKAKSAAAAKEKSSAMAQSALLALMFLGWYVASFFTDTFNKKIQARVPIPITLTFLQFLFGGLSTGIILRGLRLSPFMPLRHDQLKPILPIAACWTLGFLSTNLSLGNTAVSFTHAVKATEPLFLVVIGTFAFGHVFAPAIWLSLLPIAFGIALVAASDLSFTVPGFLAAALANCCFVSRSLLVKDVLGLGLVDNVNLYYYISWISASVAFVLACVFELPTLLAHRNEFTLSFAAMALANGVLHYVYNQLSMLILARVAALTHSIGNAARRFVIIMVSVLYFGQDISRQTLLGIALLVLGVFSYVYARATATPVAAKAKTSAPRKE